MKRAIFNIVLGMFYGVTMMAICLWLWSLGNPIPATEIPPASLWLKLVIGGALGIAVIFLTPKCNRVTKKGKNNNAQ